MQKGDFNNMPDLEHLDLSHNQMFGIIDQQGDQRARFEYSLDLAEPGQLKWLDLSHNNMPR